MSSAGDVNGDGFDDVIVTAPRYRNERGEVVGRVCLYFGSRDGLSTQPGWVATGDQAGADFGGSAFGAGDVNGDGYDDIIMVANKHDGQQQDEGRVVLYFGSPQGPSAASAPDWVFVGSHKGDHLTVRGAAGDVNGDGFDDVILLYRADPLNAPRDMSLMVFHGSATGPGSSPVCIIHPEQSGSYFGGLVVAVGDVNGDGFDDVLITAPLFTGLYDKEGKAYLHYGSATGLNPQPGWTAVYERNNHDGVDDPKSQLFSNAAAGGGDLNGDGFADIVIGAPFAGNGDRDEGMVFVYLGSTNGPSATPDWSAEGNHADCLFGDGVSIAGDLNGDGFDDLAIAVTQATHGEFREGVVAVYYGSPRGLGKYPDWTTESDQSNARLGTCVGSASDVNGDGYADLLAASVHFRPAADTSDEVGRAFVFYGSERGLAGSTGWTTRKRLLFALQQRLDALRPTIIVGTGLVLLGVMAALVVAWRRALGQVRAAVRRQAQAEERVRLARDLHDDLGARLTRISVLTEVIQRDTAASEPTRQSAMVLGQTAREILEAMSPSAWSVDPAHDTLESLVSFILTHANSFFEASEITLKADAPVEMPERKVPADKRRNIFLAVKEALNNVVKHSGATEVGLRIAFAEPELTIMVEDNGRGLPTGPANEFGKGLKNMLQRMVEAGGNFTVETRTEGGVRVKLVARI